MATITIPNKWSPRKYQLKALKALDNGVKRVVSVWHRRGGKDTTALNYTAKRMMGTVGNYWHLFPLQTQARKAIWKGINKDGQSILDQVFPPEIVKSKNGTEMVIELINGSTWQLCGSDNYNNLVGSNPIGVVFSEWSLCNPLAWSYIRPILAENGGWAWFIYTPRGKNHGYTLYQLAKKSLGWFAEILTVDDTGAISQEILKEEEEEMDDSDFQQEYYCSFDAAIKGAYYSKEFKVIDAENRICSVPHDPNAKVYTAWDLGHKDATAIWFYQIVGNEIHIIDYYYATGVDIDHYAEQILGYQIAYDDDGSVSIGLKDLKGAEHRQKYDYESHGLPHDARAKTLASGGKSVQEQVAAHLGWDKVKIVPSLSKQDGRQAVRKMLKNTWFDANRCEEHGVAALREYQREWDDKNKIFKKDHLHNWASDPADAFRYLAIAYEVEYMTEDNNDDYIDDSYGIYEEDGDNWRTN